MQRFIQDNHRPTERGTRERERERERERGGEKNKHTHKKLKQMQPEREREREIFKCGFIHNERFRNAGGNSLRSIRGAFPFDC